MLKIKTFTTVHLLCTFIVDNERTSVIFFLCISTLNSLIVEEHAECIQFKLPIKIFKYTKIQITNNNPSMCIK